jgi:hypothetical protein
MNDTPVKPKLPDPRPPREDEKNPRRDLPDKEKRGIFNILTLWSSDRSSNIPESEIPQSEQINPTSKPPNPKPAPLLNQPPARRGGFWQ